MMTQRTTATDTDLDWLLDGLVDQVAGTRHAIVLSDDGLVVSRSRTIERATPNGWPRSPPASRAWPAASGSSSAAGRSTRSSSRWPTLWLFVTAAGRGTHLAVVASQEVDAELMSVAMHTLVQQVGQQLGTDARGPHADDRARHG